MRGVVAYVEYQGKGKILIEPTVTKLATTNKDSIT